MAHVLMAHPEFTELFERVITADKITRSKPDPECYLLAARELQMEVDVCCVFEDSFSGIEAGRRAGMKVVGLATTNPREKIQDKVDGVLSDFTGCVYDEFIGLMERWSKVCKVHKVHKVTGVLRVILNGNSELPLTKHLQGSKDLIDL